MYCSVQYSTSVHVLYRLVWTCHFGALWVTGPPGAVSWVTEKVRPLRFPTGAGACHDALSHGDLARRRISYAGLGLS